MASAIVVWGHGDQYVVNCEIFYKMKLDVKAVIDNVLESVPKIHNNFFSNFETFKEWYLNENLELHSVVAIGNPYGTKRMEYATLLKSIGIKPVSIEHSNIHISKSALIGEGAQIMNDVIVNAHSILGDQVILNTRAIIEHHVSMGNGCEIAPGAVVLGRVKIGNNVWVGANSVILPRIQIGNNVIIGAGSVVTKDVPDDCVMVGNPARWLKPF